MTDYTPGSYFPSSYYAPSYFGGELSGTVNISASISSVASVSASLTFTGQAVRQGLVSGAGTQRRRKKPLFYAEIDGKRIFGTAAELDALFEAYRLQQQAEKVVKIKKPRKVAAKTVSAPVGTPVLDALTAIARLEERARIAANDKAAKEAYKRMLEEDEDEAMALLLAA